MELQRTQHDRSVFSLSILDYLHSLKDLVEVCVCFFS